MCHLATEKLGVVQRGLIHHDRNALRLDAFHHALDGAGTEVVRAGFHGQAIDADNGMCSARIDELIYPCDHLVGDEVFSRAVGVDDGLDEVLWHILIVRQELFGILRKAIPAVSETRVIVTVANPGVQANTVDDLRGVQTTHLGIGVQLVEVRDAQGKIGVGKKLDRLRLGRAHDECGHILVLGALL